MGLDIGFLYGRFLNRLGFAAESCQNIAILQNSHVLRLNRKNKVILFKIERIKYSHIYTPANIKELLKRFHSILFKCSLGKCKILDCTKNWI